MGQESIESLTNRTDPSANAQFTPPGWWLATVLLNSPCSNSRSRTARSGFGGKYALLRVQRGLPAFHRENEAGLRPSRALEVSAKRSVELRPSVTAAGLVALSAKIRPVWLTIRPASPRTSVSREPGTRWKSWSVHAPVMAP